VSILGNVTAGGAFTVQSYQNSSIFSQCQLGLVQAGNVSILAQALALSGPLTSSGTVTLAAQAGFGGLLTSGITAVGTVNIFVAGSQPQLAIGGAGISTSGGISLVASGADGRITGPQQQLFMSLLKAGSAGISIQATGQVFVGAASTTGNFTAVADFDGNGIGPYSQAGQVTAGNISISGADVQLSGSLTTTGQASVTTTYIAPNGPSGSLSVNAGSGGITAAKGILLTGTGFSSDISVMDVLKSVAGPIQLQTSSSISIGADVTAGGAFSASADLNPSVTVGYSQQGNVQAGSVSISGHNIALTGALTSTTFVTLAALGFNGLVTTSTITAGGLVSIAAVGAAGASGTINLGSGGINTTGGIRLVAQGQLGSISGQQAALPGPLKAGAAGIQLLSTGQILMGSAVTTGVYSAVADSDNNGTGVFTQLGTVTANGVVISGAGVSLNGALTSGGQVTVSSTSPAGGPLVNLVIAAGAPITAGGISLTTKGPGAGVSVSDALTAKSGAVVIQTGGVVTLGGNVSAATAFVVNAYAGLPLVNVPSYIQTGKVSAGSVSIFASGIMVGGAISATSGVALQSVQSSSTGILIAGGSGGVTAGGAISLTASGGVTGFVSVLDVLTSRSSSVNVQALTGILVGASVSAAGAATFNANANPVLVGNFLQNQSGAIRGNSITIVASSINLATTSTAQTGITLNGALTLANATFTAGASSRVAIASDVTASGTSRIAGNLFLGNQTRTFTLSSQSDSLTVTGVVSGTPTVGLIEVGAGTIALQGKNTYTGPTILNGGTLALTGTQATSSVVVNAGATLTGTGAVSQLMVLGGTVSPGTSTALGITTTTGPVTFAPSIANVIPTFTVKISNLASDALKAGDSVNLGVGAQGAALNIALLNGATPAAGKKFTIVTSSGLIGNFTFGGTALNDGDTFTVGTANFRINYVGGSVVLTVV
jgi:hypothetical protein